LTIGMATYDDYDGCYFTLQSLRLHHDLSQVELMVVDNKPDSPGSADLKNKVEGWMRHGTAGTRYVAAPEVVGTSAPRDRVFRLANGEAVMCVDSHVLLAPGAIARLIEWYDAHPESHDLIQGPMLLDHLAGVQTHFIDTWRSEMWGIWGSAWEVCPGGDRVSVIEHNGRVQFVSLDMDHVPLSSSAACGAALPDVAWAGHEKHLLAAGMRPLGLDANDEFDIPGQGLGLFSCRRDAWLGFNADFRGFGGEEMYIHEKFRQAGHRCLCLGFLKWLHRFTRPGGVKYPLTRWNKVRNYVLGHQELGLPLDRVREHFVASGLVPQQEWDALAADAQGTVNPPAPRAPETVAEIYRHVLGTPRDLDEHMPLLAKMASECNHVTEFSHRRESLIAFAMGNPAKVVSHNAELGDALAQTLLAKAPQVTADTLDSPDVPEIDETDLLFLDRVHTKARVLEELKKYAPRVTRWIVLHDTQSHANRGEDGGPGLIAALREFLESEDGRKWFIVSHTANQYGLTVLGKQEIDRPASAVLLWSPGFGPGTQLKALLKTLGIEPSPKCDCNARAMQMDVWGVAGCREHRDEIVGWMRDGQTRWGWKDKVAAAAKAVTSGLAFKLNPLDPYPSLIDEAIRLAEENETKATA
jgi:hypothetical protein